MEGPGGRKSGRGKGREREKESGRERERERVVNIKGTVLTD